jgi:hypothetical protein
MKKMVLSILRFVTPRSQETMSRQKLLPVSTGFSLVFLFSLKMVVPPKRQSLSELHGVTAQRTLLFLVTTMRV